MANIVGNSVDLDEVAHDEPPHQDLRCLQFQLFSSLVVKHLLIEFLASSTESSIDLSLNIVIVMK